MVACPRLLTRIGLAANLIFLGCLCYNQKSWEGVRLPSNILKILICETLPPWLLMNENRRAKVLIDTGGGIPGEYAEKVFNQFYTTKERSRGTGKRLSIAQRVVVQNHGGEALFFDVERGGGTTFHIQLAKQKP